MTPERPISPLLRPQPLDGEPGEDLRAIRSARELLREARLLADETLRGAQAEATALREAAVQSGYDEGARKAAECSLDTLRMRMTLVDALTEELRQAFLSILETALGEAPQAAPDVFPARLRVALDTIHREPLVRLGVNPAEVPETRRVLGAFQRQAGVAGTIELVAESGVVPGTAELTANGCRIVISPAEHLRRIVDHLRAAPELPFSLREALCSRIETLGRTETTGLAEERLAATELP